MSPNQVTPPISDASTLAGRRAPIARHSRRPSPFKFLTRGMRYLALLVVAIVFLIPVLWMLSASFKSNVEVLGFPPTFFPEEFRWSNYQEVFVIQPFAQQFANSVAVMAAVCLLTVTVSTMAGYAFARVKIPGASVLFLVVLSGIFIPPEATIVPLFRMATALGWIDTLYPLIVFTTFITTAPIATFIMRQAFISLPNDFGEAATIDGAGPWRVMVQVYAPLARPAMAATMVLSGWFSWNQFLEPLIFLRTTTNFTVPLALSQYEDIYAGPLWGVQMAAASLSVLPVLLLFFFAQKHVVAGLTAGGVKG